MALRYLLDENLRGPLWRALQRHNLLDQQPVDAVRVGDPDDLPLQSDDRVVLKWAEREGRVLVTRDKSTMPMHLRQHLQEGRHVPGIFMLRPDRSIHEALEFLVLAAHVSLAGEWQDRIQYIP